MSRVRRATLLLSMTAVTLLAWGTPAGAHDTTPLPLAQVAITPRGTSVTVAAQVPIVALTDVNWPRERDGSLTMSALAEPLALVARDFAARLELSEADNPLPLPAARATLGADGASVDIVMEYVAPARRGPLSARLRALPARPAAVPMRAEFIAAEGVTRSFEVTGPTERIVFEPSTGAVAAQFLARGAREVLNGWGALLFVLCLGMTLRPAATVRRAAALWLSVQAVATLAAGVAGVSAGVIAAVHAVAASVVVMAALLGLINPASRWILALAALFGVVSGAELGASFADARAFAGGHAGVGLLVIVTVTAAGYAWMIALAAAASALVRGWGVPERLLSAAVGLFAAHNALHLMEPVVPADTDHVSSQSFLVGLAGAWVAIAIVVNWWSRRVGPGSRADRTVM